MITCHIIDVAKILSGGALFFLKKIDDLFSLVALERRSKATKSTKYPKNVPQFTLAVLVGALVRSSTRSNPSQEALYKYTFTFTLPLLGVLVVHLQIFPVNYA